MIILDFIFKSFYVYLTKFGDNGKTAALIPIGMAMSCILIFSFSYMFALVGSSFLNTVTGIGFAVLTVLFYYLSSKVFEYIYVKQKRIITFTSFKGIYYLMGIIILFGGSFLLVYSFKYA